MSFACGFFDLAKRLDQRAIDTERTDLEILEGAQRLDPVKRAGRDSLFAK